MKNIIETDSFEEYKEKNCPKCKHYRIREYKECNIVKQINNKVNCINYEEYNG